MVSRGDVWWAELPDVGRRPVCVLTRQHAIPVLARVLVAPVTETVRGIPTEVFLDQADGMEAQCVISLDNVRAVPKSYLSERITGLSPAKLRELCVALRRATGC